MSFVTAPRLQLVLALSLLIGAAWIAKVAVRMFRDIRIVHSPIFGRLWIVPTQPQPLLLSLCQCADGVRFQLRAALGKPPKPQQVSLVSLRPDGLGQRFELVDLGTHLESADVVPEPHVFTVRLWCSPDPRGHDVEIEALDVHQGLDEAMPSTLSAAGPPAREDGGRRPRGLDTIKAGAALALSTIIGLLSVAMAAVSVQAILSE